MKTYLSINYPAKYGAFISQPHLKVKKGQLIGADLEVVVGKQNPRNSETIIPY